MITLKDNKNNHHKRERQIQYLSQAIQLEEAVNPHIIRATMSMVSLALFAFLLWAGFTNINEVARTPGEVVPNGYQQTVQHLEGGLVEKIRVQEGQIVEEGQSLVSLSAASLNQDLERTQAKQQGLEMKAERLRAFIDGRDPDFSSFGLTKDKTLQDQKAFFEGMRDAREKEKRVLRDQIKEKQQSITALQADIRVSNQDLKLANNLYQKRKDLNTQGYASDMQLLEDERQVNRIQGDIGRLKNQIVITRTEISEYQNRLISLSATQQDEAYERLSETENELSQNKKIIQKLEERIARLNIKSPARGLVKGLSVNTIGAVIQPGQDIMEIIPLDKNLEVSVKISPQDIGHIEIGQPVQVKFSTYDFSRYGFITGTLDHISATTFDGEEGDRYYQGRVLLSQNHVGKDKSNIIMPGMTVMADVITGEKTILQYMLKPIHVSLNTAFSER